MPEEQVLAASGVEVRFEGVRAVDKVDLSVRPRVVLGLIGPNGAGKTSLVNAMTGFRHADRGRVFFGNIEITRAPPEKVARLGVARTFQSARVFRRMTVLENVEVAALTVARRRKAVRRHACEIVDLVGLAHRQDVSAGSLPFGEERMVGIARALALNPSLVLMDEPAAGLNEQETDRLAQLVRRLRDEHGCGVLLIEHDMRIVMSVCDTIHVLHHGRSLFEGAPAEAQRDEAVISAFLGRKQVAGATG
jgi:ABC-type branched-subunit amino acid transport system ATPase component